MVSIPGPESSRSSPIVALQDHSEDEAAAAGGDSDDERRHAAMLADVRAAGDAGRKRKRRDVLMSEAYPESEYNLNPASASGGEAALAVPFLPACHRTICLQSARVITVATLPCKYAMQIGSQHSCEMCDGRASRVNTRTVMLLAGGDGGELQLSDLIKGLGSSRSKLGASRKLLERLERRGQAVAAPLPGNVQARHPYTCSPRFAWRLGVSLSVPNTWLKLGLSHQVS